MPELGTCMRCTRSATEAAVLKVNLLPTEILHVV